MKALQTGSKGVHGACGVWLLLSFLVVPFFIILVVLFFIILVICFFIILVVLFFIILVICFFIILAAVVVSSGVLP